MIWALFDSRQAAKHQAEQATSNLALSLERNIGHTIEGLDLSLRSALQTMELTGLAALDPVARQSVLFDRTAAASTFGGIFITDEDGQSVYNSLESMPTVISIADRDYFQSQKATPGLGLVVSKPFQSRADGEWLIAFSRRLDHADGSFAGVVAAALRLSYFEGLFRALDLGEHGSVALFGADRQIVMRWPISTDRLRLKASSAQLFSHLATAPSGMYKGVSVVDGMQRVVSYRQITGLPLVLAVGFATQDMYALWAEKAALLGIVVVVLLILIVGMGWELNVELRRRAAAEQSAMQSADEAIRCAYEAMQSEQAHAAAHARLEALFRYSKDAKFIACRDADGAFVYESVNPVWEELSGLPAASAIGLTPDLCWPADVASIILAGWRACASERRAVGYAFSIAGPVGQRNWDVLVAPVIGTDGDIVRLIGSARDVTERNQLEAKLRQAQRMEAIGQLTAGIAHDFNNMLQPILGGMDLLREQSGLNEEGRECVAITEGAARRSATLVHRLLAFSRQQQLEPVLLCPEKVVENMVALLGRTLGGRVQLESSVNAAGSLVRADGAQLDNCLFHLALNARDAMPQGGVLRLSVDNREAAEPSGLPPGEYVRFIVGDEGAGMPRETLAHAMEPFFTTKPVGQGTGLGLAMVQGFARQSGGEVRIESEVGRGTTVSIWLPRATGVPSAVTPAVASRRAVEGGRQRVLVADDEEGVRRTQLLFLKKAGFTAVAVSSGEAAMDLLQEDQAFDLLVTDQSMPGMTGCELIEAVTRRFPSLPTLLVTGYDKVSGLDRLDGRVTVLRKPFDRASFLHQIRVLIGIAAPEPAPAQPAGRKPGDVAAAD